MSEQLAEKPKPWRPVDTFGARLCLLRNHYRLDVKEMAALCGLPAPTWRTWEKGSIPHDVRRVARKISERSGCDYVWLIDGGELPNESTRWYVPGLEAAGQPHLYVVGPVRLPGIR